MKKIEKINNSFLARDAREVSEYAQLLVGFTYVDPVTPSKDYDFFKKNFQNSLLNKIRQLEKQLKVFGDLS